MTITLGQSTVAPEIIQMQPPTTACDIWSLGITIIGLSSLSPISNMKKKNVLTTTNMEQNC